MPANLPHIPNNSNNDSDLTRVNAVVAPLSQRASLAKPAAATRRASEAGNKKQENDDYLPIMMLNPPIALFDQDDDRLYQNHHK